MARRISMHSLTAEDEAMIDMITSLQSARMDSQRAELRPTRPAPALPGISVVPPTPVGPAPAASAPDDDLLDMIARVQGSRLDEQRTELPRPPSTPAPPVTPVTPTDPSSPPPEARSRSTVPDDDFFALLMRAQAPRMEDQRATIPLQENRQNKPAKK